MAKNKNKKSVLPVDAFQNPVLLWYAPDFIRYHKGLLWYIVAALINAALLTYAYFNESITMMIVFAVLPVLFLLEQRHKPKWTEIIVSHYGIKVAEKKYPFSNINRFWIVHHPPYINELHFFIGDKIHSEIVVQLMNTDPVLVRNFLVTQIREWEGKNESIIDTLVRVLKLA